jgi:hypothetical protein
MDGAKGGRKGKDGCTTGGVAAKPPHLAQGCPAAVGAAPKSGPPISQRARGLEFLQKAASLSLGGTHCTFGSFERFRNAPYLRRGAALPLPGAASIALRQRSCSEHPGRDHRYIGSLGRLLDLHFELWLATGGRAPGYGPFRQLLQPVPPAPSRWPAAWVERGAQGQEVKQRFL